MWTLENEDTCIVHTLSQGSKADLDILIIRTLLVDPKVSILYNYTGSTVDTKEPDLVTFVFFLCQLMLQNTQLRAHHNVQCTNHVCMLKIFINTILLDNE